MPADVKLTLACYEEPAARHQVDDWRREMDSRIVSWTGAADSFELVKLDSGELVVLVAVPDGNPDYRLELIGEMFGGRRTKLLWFGRIDIHAAYRILA